MRKMIVLAGVVVSTSGWALETPLTCKTIASDMLEIHPEAKGIACSAYENSCRVQKYIEGAKKKNDPMAPSADAINRAELDKFRTLCVMAIKALSPDVVILSQKKEGVKKPQGMDAPIKVKPLNA